MVIIVLYYVRFYSWAKEAAFLFHATVVDTRQLRLLGCVTIDTNNWFAFFQWCWVWCYIANVHSPYTFVYYYWCMSATATAHLLTTMAFNNASLFFSSIWVILIPDPHRSLLIFSALFASRSRRLSLPRRPLHLVRPTFCSPIEFQLSFFACNCACLPVYNRF